MKNDDDFAFLHEAYQILCVEISNKKNNNQKTTLEHINVTGGKKSV